MQLVLLQSGAWVRCVMCHDTGFRPVKRARLYVNALRRERDLREFIIYVLCGYCDFWIRHAQGGAAGMVR
jgi:hypothetical protein